MDDLESNVSYGKESITDVTMFSLLANPERTDMARMPKVSLSAPLVDTIEECDEEPRITEVLTSPNVGSAQPRSQSVIQDLVFHDIHEEECMNDNHPRPATPDVSHPHPDAPVPPPGTDPELAPQPAEADPKREPESSPSHPADEDEVLHKRTVLLDLQQLSTRGGVKLTKEWTMDDRLEDMLLEMRRHSLAQDEKTNVTMMRDGMRLLITGIEMANNKLGLLDLDGWSTDVCRDLEKHDANLSRIYRKYWRRGTASSPEVSITMSLLGSMGMHHFRRTMSKNLVSKAQQQGFAPRKRRGQVVPPPADSDSSDDEEAPPR